MSDCKSQDTVIGVAICPLHKNRSPDQLARSVFHLLNGVGVRPSDISRLYVNTKSGYARVLLNGCEIEDYVMRILTDTPNLMHVHDLSSIIKNPSALKVSRLSQFCPRSDKDEVKEDPPANLCSRKRHKPTEEGPPYMCDCSTLSDQIQEASVADKAGSSLAATSNIKEGVAGTSSQKTKGYTEAAVGTVSEEVSKGANDVAKAPECKIKTTDNRAQIRTKAIEGTSIDVTEVALNVTSRDMIDITPKYTPQPRDEIEITAASLVEYVIQQADLTSNSKRPPDSLRHPEIVLFSDTTCSIESFFSESDCDEIDEDNQFPFKTDMATSTSDILQTPEEEQEMLLQVEAKTSTPFTTPCSCPGTIFYYLSQYVGPETRYAEFKLCGAIRDEIRYDRPRPKADFMTLVGKYVCGFLNCEGGTLYLGVADDGRVVGIKMSSSFEGKVRGDIEYAIDMIRPPVDKTEYTINFPQVKKNDVDVKLYSELKVIEICVKPRNPPRIFYTFRSVAYLRRDGSLQTLGAVWP